MGLCPPLPLSLSLSLSPEKTVRGDSENGEGEDTLEQSYTILLQA